MLALCSTIFRGVLDTILEGICITLGCIFGLNQLFAITERKPFQRGRNFDTITMDFDATWEMFG